jgi:hypothetical protein
MFLKQLYQHNKFIAILVMAFFAVQIFINYKQGAVASPFYHYGMYSATMKIDSAYDIRLVYSKGQILRGQDISIRHWDKLHNTIEKSTNEQATNDSILLTVNKFFNKLHWPIDPQNFRNSWLRQKEEDRLPAYQLFSLQEFAIDSVIIKKYVWQQAQLVPKN